MEQKYYKEEKIMNLKSWLSLSMIMIGLIGSAIFGFEGFIP